MTEQRKRLLIVGAGSSGLVTTKTALAKLSDWDVVCFEKSGDLIGCWGNPYQGFVSTTTRFATQFAALPEFEPVMKEGDQTEYKQFFCNGEYGDYLKRFAERFDLSPHIRLHHTVSCIQRDHDQERWIVKYECDKSVQRSEAFDAVVICTGLVSKPGEIDFDSTATQTSLCKDVSRIEQNIRNKVVVVSGGGESAVDTAKRLATPSLANRVYLSLRSGIRVSPRYHPIRGVPSDFLRNRLMLSISPTLRNCLGDWFVRGRIRFENGIMARLTRQEQRKRKWAMRLHLAAGEDLFDMFHNKSDGFLEAVGDGRIRIIGPPNDKRWQTFGLFGRPDRSVDVAPDVIVPAIGFRSSLAGLFQPAIELREFYLGCVHSKYENLFAVGFARPVIGNIPSISELQARLACQYLAGEIDRPESIVDQNSRDWLEKQTRFSTLGERLRWVYPVEMFDYCDRLARLANCMPTLKRCGSVSVWLKTRLGAATTLAYAIDEPEVRDLLRRSPIYLPWFLIGILICLKPIDWMVRLYRWPLSALKRS